MELFARLMLFAEDAVPEQPAQPGSIFQQPAFLLLILMGVFFFMVILPAQRREKRDRESLMSKLKKNDEVVTSAGIIGVVQIIKEGGDEVTLKIDENAKIRVLKSSIVRILS